MQLVLGAACNSVLLLGKGMCPSSHNCSLSCNAGFAGSRSGALIATAWTSLVHMGEQGFMHITQQLMQVPPDDSTTSLHATCSFKLQHSCNFSYLLPSHVSWSSLNLTSPMLEFDKI